MRLYRGSLSLAAVCAAALMLVTVRAQQDLPAQAADLADDVVWLPAHSIGRGLLADLASPGSSVEVERG